jgi:hypothetical protein
MKWHPPTAPVVLAVLLGLMGPAILADTAAAQTSPGSPGPAVRSVSQGRAKTVIENLYKCPNEAAPNRRIVAVGTVTSTDGKAWTVPAETAFEKGPKAADLFNQCNKAEPANFAALRPNDVPVVEVDPDGEVITAYIIGDNYWELYVNGKLVAVDANPYTPFNSSIVRFKAKRPITYAVKAVDWEENLGLASELFAGAEYHPGDGGFIARFSDGTVTDSSWKAQSFYIAPLEKHESVVENGNVHDTSRLGRIYPVHPHVAACKDQCYAVHYPIPDGWTSPSFDDSSWPRAYEFTDTDVGTDNLPAYTKYPEVFAGARWIWSINLVLDNTVILRKTVR